MNYRGHAAEADLAVPASPVSVKVAKKPDMLGSMRHERRRHWLCAPVINAARSSGSRNEDGTGGPQL